MHSVCCSHPAAGMVEWAQCKWGPFIKFENSLARRLRQVTGGRAGFDPNHVCTYLPPSSYRTRRQVGTNSAIGESKPLEYFSYSLKDHEFFQSKNIIAFEVSLVVTYPLAPVT